MELIVEAAFCPLADWTRRQDATVTFGRRLRSHLPLESVREQPLLSIRLGEMSRTALNAGKRQQKTGHCMVLDATVPVPTDRFGKKSKLSDPQIPTCSTANCPHCHGSPPNATQSCLESPMAITWTCSSTRGAVGGSLSLLTGAALRAQAGDHVASANQIAGFGKAKRVLMMFMWGGPSQLDTLDPKPNAPLEVRGEFGVIQTATPGLILSEHFRRLAAISDLVTVIRSLNHDDPAHLSSAHTTLTGQLPPVNKSDDEPPSRNDSPQTGALLSRFHTAQGGLPSSVMLPWKTFHPAAPGGVSPGNPEAGSAHRRTQCWSQAIQISRTGPSRAAVDGRSRYITSAKSTAFVDRD